MKENDIRKIALAFGWKARRIPSIYRGKGETDYWRFVLNSRVTVNARRIELEGIGDTWLFILRGRSSRKYFPISVDMDGDMDFERSYQSELALIVIRAFVRLDVNIQRLESKYGMVTAHECLEWQFEYNTWLHDAGL